MNADQLNPQLLTVGALFAHETSYTVPVYQRNYAWGSEQIKQLIDDVLDAMGQGEGQGYFLGNLVVTRKPPTQYFEVVDGQQRLTTLYLLLAFLAKDGSDALPSYQGRLRYESRARASEALRRADHDAFTRQQHTGAQEEDIGIHEGLKIIEQHERLQTPAERSRFAVFLVTQVTVVRAELPAKTDLNRYFEVMNTRGQQLKPVDIVKARLMSELPEAEHAGFAWVWEACSDMHSYVQMPLTRGDTALRKALFGEDWSWLRIPDFQALLAAQQSPGVQVSAPAASALLLDEALRQYARSEEQDHGPNDSGDRFRSPLGFSSFLLHVLKTMDGDATQEDEGRLDDKRLVHTFSTALKALAAHQRAAWVQGFAFTLLKCRNLFDSFVLKRQVVAGAPGDEGDWSLQRMKMRMSQGRPTLGYTPTFSHWMQYGDARGDASADDETQDVLLLQSMLRITYTSPRSMHWITHALRWLMAQHPGAVRGADFAQLLRNYARAKVAAAFLRHEPPPQGFDISRIVFTYLDYLLLDQSSRRYFKFQFRDSIEHFHPQNPSEDQSAAPVTKEKLHLLGNLALVSVSVNSKFSNSPALAKALGFEKVIANQSPKLAKMAQITLERGAWDDLQVQLHHDDMVQLLRADVPSTLVA